MKLRLFATLVLPTLLSSLPALATPLSRSIPEASHAPWENGISLVSHLDLESVSNLSGGLARGSTGAGVWKGALALHTGKAGWWHGGVFLVEGLVGNSGAPDTLYVGDLQGVSNLTTPYSHTTRLYKAYYRQFLGPYTLRIGLLNPNDYFNTTGVAADLLNASYGIYPTITDNIAYTPTYPYSSLGLMATATWGATTLQTGLFDADGVHPFRRPWGSDGVIVYGEIDENLATGPGQLTLKAGGYYNHATSPYLQQTIAIGPAPSQGGYYGAAEYRWKTATDLQWGAFLQGGGAPNSADTSAVNAYLSAGLRLRHFVPASPGATLSLGVNRAWQRQSGAETNLEINYHQPLLKGLFLSPDLQYVINPGANPSIARLPNALVFILRLGWRYSLQG